MDVCAGDFAKLLQMPYLAIPEYPVTCRDRTAAVRSSTHDAERIPMAKFKALSRGSQLVLVAGPLLLFSLFFTWQNVEVDYGRAGVATLPLDGWDAWGLLLALLVMATVAHRRARKPHRRRAVGRRSLAEDHARARRGDPRRRRREEPDGRRLVVDRATASSDSPSLSRSARTSTGRQRESPTARFSQRKRRGISSVA